MTIGKKHDAALEKKDQLIISLFHESHMMNPILLYVVSTQIYFEFYIQNLIGAVL